MSREKKLEEFTPGQKQKFRVKEIVKKNGPLEQDKHKQKIEVQSQKITSKFEKPSTYGYTPSDYVNETVLNQSENHQLDTMFKRNRKSKTTM